MAVSINTGKVLDKIQYIFMIKKKNRKQEKEGNFLKLIKGSMKNLQLTYN